MARGFARIVVAVGLGVSIVAAPVLTAAPVLAVGAFDAQAAADKAVANAISMGGTSASIISENITRLILNNPGYAAQIVKAIMAKAGDPATPAGLATALGVGLGAAMGLARDTDLAKKISQLIEAEGKNFPSGALSNFSAGAVSGFYAAASGTVPKAANIPTQATLAAVLAKFSNGLPVDEVGTVSRN